MPLIEARPEKSELLSLWLQLQLYREQSGEKVHVPCYNGELAPLKTGEHMPGASAVADDGYLLNVLHSMFIIT